MKKQFKIKSRPLQKATIITAIGLSTALSAMHTGHHDLETALLLSRLAYQEQQAAQAAAEDEALVAAIAASTAEQTAAPEYVPTEEEQLALAISASENTATTDATADITAAEDETLAAAIAASTQEPAVDHAERMPIEEEQLAAAMAETEREAAVAATRARTAEDDYQRAVAASLNENLAAASVEQDDDEEVTLDRRRPATCPVAPAVNGAQNAPAATTPLNTASLSSANTATVVGITPDILAVLLRRAHAGEIQLPKRVEILAYKAVCHHDGQYGIDKIPTAEKLVFFNGQLVGFLPEIEAELKTQDLKLFWRQLKTKNVIVYTGCLAIMTPVTQKLQEADQPLLPLTIDEIRLMLPQILTREQMLHMTISKIEEELSKPANTENGQDHQTLTAVLQDWKNEGHK